MSKLDYPRKAAALFRKAVVNAQPSAEDIVNADRLRAFTEIAEDADRAALNLPPKSRSGSKHPPGYMTAYMRGYRAKK